MVLEVSVIEEKDSVEVQVWNVESEEREEEMERTFDHPTEASTYIDSLVQDKRYVVHHK